MTGSTSCNTFYIDNYRTVSRDVCREVPEDVCKDVLREKYVDVPSEVCNYVTMAPLLTSPSMALFTSNYKEDHGPSTIFLSPILSSSMETLLNSSSMFNKLDEEGAVFRQDLEDLQVDLGRLMEKHGRCLMKSIS